MLAKLVLWLREARLELHECSLVSDPRLRADGQRCMPAHDSAGELCIQLSRRYLVMMCVRVDAINNSRLSSLVSNSMPRPVLVDMRTNKEVQLPASVQSHISLITLGSSVLHRTV